jgi:sugar-phosphatase
MTSLFEQNPTVERLEVEGLLFDLDGVLVDSGDAVTRHWIAFAERRSLPVGLVAERAHGRRSFDVIRELVSADEVHAEAEWFEQLEIADTSGVRAVAGAEELLRSLPDDRWAIVTSCGIRLAEARLHSAGLAAPPAIVTADDVPVGKPDPHCYRLGLQALGVDASNAVVFEDAPSGLEAGWRAGIPCIAVATTFPADDLVAGWVVRDLASVEASPTPTGVVHLKLEVG